MEHFGLAVLWLLVTFCTRPKLVVQAQAFADSGEVSGETVGFFKLEFSEHVAWRGLDIAGPCSRARVRSAEKFRRQYRVPGLLVDPCDVRGRCEATSKYLCCVSAMRVLASSTQTALDIGSLTSRT